jgi:hypothetical protein
MCRHGGWAAAEGRLIENSCRITAKTGCKANLDGARHLLLLLHPLLSVLKSDLSCTKVIVCRLHEAALRPLGRTRIPKGPRGFRPALSPLGLPPAVLCATLCPLLGHVRPRALVDADDGAVELRVAELRQRWRIMAPT